MRKQILTLILLFLGLTSFSQTSDCYSTKFDGTSTVYVQTPTSQWDVKNITIECWVRLLNYPGDSDLHQIVINYPTTVAHRLEYLSIKRDTLFGRIGNSIVKCQYPYVGITSTLDSNWHHVALVRNNGSSVHTLFLFLDGVLKDTENVSTVTSINLSISTHVGGGKILTPSDTAGYNCTAPACYPGYFRGNMSRFRITLDTLYHNNFTPSCLYDTVTKMKLFYKFSEGNDSTKRYTSTTSFIKIPILSTTSASGYSLQGPCINTTFTSVSGCSPYIWNGQTITSSGIYQYATVPCQQTQVMYLTINNNNNYGFSTVCDSYTWSNGQTYTTSGTYIHTFTNLFGCDSVYTLGLN